MIPLLAAGIFLGARSVSKPEPPARIESTQKENPETPDPTPAVPAPGLGNAWKDLMEGWRENDDDRFEAGMSWIMARGTDLVPELRERMLDREGSLESRLFAAELLLRIDGKTDRGVVLEAMMDLCRTPGGRKRLANMIKTEEGEIRVYEIARDAIMAAETQDRLPALMEGLNSGDSETRVTALKTLSQLTLDPSLIRDRVAALLKDENPEVRGEALALVPTLFPGKPPPSFRERSRPKSIRRWFSTRGECGRRWRRRRISPASRNCRGPIPARSPAWPPPTWPPP